MNWKIVKSAAVIGVALGLIGGATMAYFSNTETSVGNVLTAGIVDIKVDGQNPWSKTYSEKLSDMKPCQTRYIEFTIRNVWNSNPVKIWKHIDITDQSDGVVTEPECKEGGGTWNQGGNPQCGGSYTPRNNLAAYTIYDLHVCADPGSGGCETDGGTGAPTGGHWAAVIGEDQYVRLDNISSTWIYLGQLDPAKDLKVVQSYHLRSWPDAPEPEVTNWAQGDVMTFNIDLYAEQLGGPGPKGVQASLTLENKNPTTWAPIEGDEIGGTLTYNTSGSTFIYSFTGKVPQPSTGYCLIYYADPWPGDGKTQSTGMDINCGSSGANANLFLSGNQNLGTDLPNLDDQNYPGGAKLQIVLDADYDNANDKMTGWNPSSYLFELNLINYDDTDV